MALLADSVPMGSLPLPSPSQYLQMLSSTCAAWPSVATMGCKPVSDMPQYISQTNRTAQEKHYEPGQQFKESAAFPALERITLMPLSSAQRPSGMPLIDIVEPVLKASAPANCDDSGSECSTADTSMQGTLSLERPEELTEPESKWPRAEGGVVTLRLEEAVAAAEACTEQWWPSPAAEPYPDPSSSGMAPLLDTLTDRQKQRPPVTAVLRTNNSSPPGLVLQLEHALPQPLKEVNLDGLPSIGSAEHSIGRCKPCAFFHSKGCESGVSCSFCHICDLGERQKRRRARKTLIRALHRARQ